MAAGVPRGKDAAGGTCWSERDSGVLKSQGQGGKEDPERGVGSGAGGPQVSAAGRPRRAPARPRRRGHRGPLPSHLPWSRIPAPAAVLTSSPASSSPSPQSPCPHPTLSASPILLPHLSAGILDSYPKLESLALPLPALHPRLALASPLPHPLSASAHS